MDFANEKTYAPMLLVVSSLVIAPLVVGPRPLLALLLSLLLGKHLLLLDLTDTNHAKTALCTSDDLTATVVSSVSGLLFVVGIVTAFDGSLGRSLFGSRIVAEVLAIVLGKRTVTCCTSCRQVQFVFVVIDSVRS